MHHGSPSIFALSKSSSIQLSTNTGQSCPDGHAIGNLVLRCVEVKIIELTVINVWEA
jgi:hypothetical protein